MNAIDPSVWSALESTQIPGGSLAARPAAPDVTELFLCALASDRRRHFVIPIDADIEFEDKNSRGLTVEAKDMHLPGKRPRRYIDIECTDGAGHSAFDLIGSDIVDLLRDPRADVVDAVRRVMVKWRRFWGQFPRMILSNEAIAGLFAEIWFICRWLLPALGTASVESWRGPVGGRHDFEWPDRSVEVKATISTRGPIHHINGIDQLNRPENGPLYLFSLQLRQEESAKNTLPQIINECSAALTSDERSLKRFEELLVATGYSPLHSADYSPIHFRIVAEALYEVRDDFPRISGADLAHGIPPGIEQVEYVINLSGFRRLRVAANPKECRVLNRSAGNTWV